MVKLLYTKFKEDKNLTKFLFVTFVRFYKHILEEAENHVKITENI